MSAQLVKADILFWQRLLASCGLYTDKLDGQWGPRTQAASDAFDALYASYKKTYGEFDPRSEAVIATLLPKAQAKARMFMAAAKVHLPFTVKLLSGTRTYAEQNALFAKRPKVTNARGGQSNHNLGIAWDAGIFVNGTYYTGRNAKEDKAYADLAKVAKAKVSGIEAGIDWRSFKDAPHYQLTTGKSVAQCRALLEAGKAYV